MRERGQFQRWHMDLSDVLKESAAWAALIPYNERDKASASLVPRNLTLFLAECFHRTLPDTYTAKADASKVTIPKAGMFLHTITTIGTREKGTTELRLHCRQPQEGQEH